MVAPTMPKLDTHEVQGSGLNANVAKQLPINQLRSEDDGLTQIAPSGFDDQPIKLSDADRAILDAKAGRGIARALVAQAVMAGLAVAVSWLVGGFTAGVSALIGAGAYFVPNAFFALRLLLGLFGPKKSNPFTFFLGEAFKLGSAVLLLGLAAYLGRGWLVWPALIFGLLCVLKGYVLLLMFRKLP
ncbi:MAG TPA: ATP synthase subunit I [Eoetvoesiella sp.]